MEMNQSLKHVNSIIKKYDIDILKTYFIYKFGKIEILYITIEQNISTINIVKHDMNHKIHSKKCIYCTIYEWLTDLFNNKNLQFDKTEMRLGWINIDLREEELYTQYLISITQDIDTNPIFSIYEEEL